jgi:hypothetical protein
LYATVRSYSTGPELAEARIAKEDDVKSLLSGIAGFKAASFPGGKEHAKYPGEGHSRGTHTAAHPAAFRERHS